MKTPRPESDPELDMKIKELDTLGSPEPYDARKHARRLLEYFQGSGTEQDNTDPVSEPEG